MLTHVLHIKRDHLTGALTDTMLIEVLNVHAYPVFTKMGQQLTKQRVGHRVCTARQLTHMAAAAMYACRKCQLHGNPMQKDVYRSLHAP